MKKLVSYVTAVTIPADVTEIGESAFGIEDPNDYHNTISNPKVTIYGVAGSYAETYAKENGIKFVAGAAPGTTVAPTEPQRPTAPAGGTAAASTQSVLLDGKDVTFYTYEIDGYNYVKLRDMAKALSGTAAQFEVSWDGVANSIALTGGKPYTVVGGEMVRNAEGKQPYQPCDSALLINGQRANLEAYTINDNNFFKLRDLGRALGFNVSWINDRIVIASGEPYSDAQ